ncbi:FliG C-terminal domain-containing protein [Candidatus Marinimicrobia bacterium]|nr:FliG C-terminal domain-containing protein [Candidatus Neomarinimicrobiota bacterium]
MDNLSGLDKAAILFQVLGESLALSMFQNISEADILRIRVRSRELRNIPVSLKQNILEEYYFKMMSTKYHNLDNGDNQLFAFLNELNDEQVFYLINTEPPKVIALAIDQLSKKRKMNLMDRFEADMKHTIIMELGKLNEIPLEGVVSVAKELKNKTSFLPSPKEFSRGGPKSIANILNQMTIEDAEQYLDQLAADDSELYTEVKKYFLSFEDLLEMPEHIMRIFWRNPEIDVDDLGKSLKNYEESLINTITSYLSKRNQTKFTLYDQPLSKRELDKVQLSFVNLARKMHDDQEINLDDVLESTDMV